MKTNEIAIEIYPNNPSLYGKTPLLNPITNAYIKYKDRLASAPNVAKKPKPTTISITVCGEETFFFFEENLTSLKHPPAPWFNNIFLNAEKPIKASLVNPQRRTEFKTLLIKSQINHLLTGKIDYRSNPQDLSSAQIDENLLFVMFHPGLNGLIPLPNEIAHKWIEHRNKILFDKKSDRLPVDENYPAFLKISLAFLEKVIQLRAAYKDNPSDPDFLNKIEMPQYYVLQYFLLLDLSQLVSGSLSEEKSALNKVLEATTAALKSSLNKEYLKLLSSPIYYELAQASYYDGQFEDAIARIDQISSKDQLINVDRLKAKICTDLGLFQLAQTLTEQLLEYDKKNVSEDIHKSLGRLGEIRIRQQRVEEAYKIYKEQIEDILAYNKASDDLDRSRLYLAHTALLLNKTDEAEELYKRTQPFSFTERHTVYWLMGSSALALRTSNYELLQHPWQETLDQMLASTIHSMPAAIAVFALSKGLEMHQETILKSIDVEPETQVENQGFISRILKFFRKQDKLEDSSTNGALKEIEDKLSEMKGKAITALINDNYLYEALYLISLGKSVGESAEELAQIQQRLNDWQAAIDKARWIDTKSESAPEIFTPGQVADLVSETLEKRDWKYLESLWPHVYPCNLIPR
jgi:tetratricopeptide (TPR) repeat protein